MAPSEEIARLEEFKENLLEWDSCVDRDRRTVLRTHLNQNKHAVRQIVIEAGCFVTVTISPPPIIGGLVMRNIDMFEHMFDTIYNQSLVTRIVDMLDQAVGVLRSPRREVITPSLTIETEVREGYAFVAMPMDPGMPELVDVLDSIKESCARCGIQAERIDDAQSNDRITDRILEAIRRAAYVIVDLTDARPNVFFEAGYSHALGKVPIYIARAGTKPEFDVKDYPIIFFSNLKALKDQLETRIRGIEENKRTAG